MNMGMKQDFSYVLIKRFFEKQLLTEEQIEQLLRTIDADIQKHYEEKLSQQKNKYEEQIATLQNELHYQQKQNQQLKQDMQTLELSTLESHKKAEILENEKKMLKHQLDEMDYVTRKTLDHIKTNIYIGQEVVNTLNHPQSSENKHYVETNQVPKPKQTPRIINED